MDFWMEENHTEGYRVHWKIRDILWRETTPFQELMVVETVEFGKALVLDGAVQTTEKDEYIYHEMIAHVALMAHPAPRDVLIIGGGDGGSLREVLRHPGVEHVDIVEIDRRVVEVCFYYLPEIAAGFSDPRVQIHYLDGSKYVKEAVHKYDLVIVDSSDPTGPAVELYGPEFYKNTWSLLKYDGMMVAHAESPTFFPAYFQTVWRNMVDFEHRHIYLTTVPTYVSGYWAFAIGSKKHDPRQPVNNKPAPEGLKCYTRELHAASFVLPPFVQKTIDEA